MTKYRYSDDPNEADPLVLRYYGRLKDLRSEGINWHGRPDQDLLNHARVMAYYEIIDRPTLPTEEATPVKANAKVLQKKKEILELKIKEMERHSAHQNLEGSSVIR